MNSASRSEKKEKRKTLLPFPNKVLPFLFHIVGNIKNMEKLFFSKQAVAIITDPQNVPLK